METIREQLSFFSKELIDEILKHSSIQDFPKNTQILKEEQYVKVLPIVINGLVKVFSKFKEKELLLYYLEPKQSCVMSFSAALKNMPSKVCASTEEDSKILLIPTNKLPNWPKEFPDLN
ncbi:hypothetical protein [Aurantibacter sp.]|uniref:Crp/Fnr family transcriptional regulator n=1 Tax=Aurantibacter sp. TaxID=2807103 RepID=UPI0032679F0C